MFLTTSVWWRPSDGTLTVRPSGPAIGCFICDAVEIRLDPAIATAAFRVAQEAPTNIARHAKARQVRVSVKRRGGSLRLVVRDDGAGFDSGAALRYGARGSGLGLLGMRSGTGPPRRPDRRPLLPGPWDPYPADHPPAASRRRGLAWKRSAS